MKSLIGFMVLCVAFSASARTIKMKPGATQEIGNTELTQLRNQPLTIQCEQELKCEIDFEYVGKEWTLKMPNGKKFGRYKTREKAIGASASLVGAKVCDRLILNDEDDKLIE